MRGSILLSCALVTACAPRFFVAQTATLDGEALKNASIHYEPMRDCWWRRMVPAQYVVDRADYRLELIMGASHEDDPPQIDVIVSGATGPSLQFPELADQPEGQKTDTGWSYQVSTAGLQGNLAMRVLARDQPLGEEQFAVRYYRCHGLGFGGD